VSCDRKAKFGIDCRTLDRIPDIGTAGNHRLYCLSVADSLLFYSRIIKCIRLFRVGMILNDSTLCSKSDRRPVG
jgi:hypothetical protein